MASGYDGTIKIDSKIDTKGFNQGVKQLGGGLNSLLGTLGKIAAVVGIAFSVAAVVNFTSSVAKLSAEFERLQISAEAVGLLHDYAAEETKKFTQTLIDNGIQTDIANRAFVNFAVNGLEENLLPALARGAQDLAVFAQNGETSSDILESLTYGILNLNELMLRRAGGGAAAVDISAAEESYKALHKINGELSVEQKRAAVAAAVLEKLKNVQGLYAISQKTAAGQLSSNVRIMNEFKAAIGSTFQSAFYKLIKGFNDLIKVMTASISTGGKLHDLFAQIGVIASFLADLLVGLFQGIAALFGVKLSSAIDTASGELENNAGVANDAADAQANLADQTEAAGKAAKGALASFDELNVLQQDTGGATGATTPDTSGFPDTAAANFSSILDEIDAKQKAIQDKVDALKAKLAEVFGPVIDAYNKYLKPALIELGGKIWDGLVWVWENILKPFGAWIVQEFAPVFVKFLAAALDVLASTFDALAPHLENIWNEVLKPFAVWLGSVLIKTFEWLTEKLKELNVWISNNQEEWALIVSIIALVAVLITTFGLAAIASLAPVIAIVAGLVFVISQLPKVWEIWKDVFVAGADFMKNAWQRDVEIIKTIWTNAFTNVGDYFSKTIDNIVALVKGKLTFAEFFKSQLNNIIDFINRMISNITYAVNSVITNLNVLGSIVPGFGRIGQISTPQIPHLATGAIIPPNASFLAMLGDQKSGKNIEAPEGLIRQIIQEEIGNVHADVSIKFEGSIGALVRELKPVLDKENVRIGGSLIKSGVTR